MGWFFKLNNMKTAMQELIKNLDYSIENSKDDNKINFRWIKFHAEILLEKEKMQIIEAYEDGKQNGMDSITNVYMYTIGEKYYNQTYNQDRELPKDVKDMLDNL